MTEKQIRQLGRTELLQMLLEQGKENEALQKKIDDLELRLQERSLRIDRLGSIAEAALVLNGVFEAAEASCSQYIENAKLFDQQREELRRQVEDETRRKAAEQLAEVQQRCSQLETETRERCARAEAETQKKCAEQIAQADKIVEEKWAQISQRLDALYQSHQGLMELVSQGLTLVPEGGHRSAEESGQKAQPEGN